MSEIRVDRIVDSTGNSPVIYLDPSVNEVRIGTGITFNATTNQIIIGDTVIGDNSGNANFGGTVTASSFVGDGSSLTNLPSDFVITNAGIHTLSNVGVGTTNPTSKLTVQDGDVKIGVNTSHGVILTDANGFSWRLIVNIDGTLTTAPI
jgi:hypothetical protein